MYITVEGPIGIGKTSLTNLLSDKFQTQCMYEEFEENPYLEKFYDDKVKWAFQTEMFFLVNRYSQIRELENNYLKNNKDIISDYNITKNLLFAKNNLDITEYEKFDEIFNILTKELIEADIIIVITGNITTLKKRIQKRGREIESNIEDEYLEYLITAYNEYIEILKSRYNDKLLIIPGDKYDFVENEKDAQTIENIVKKKIEGLKNE